MQPVNLDHLRRILTMFPEGSKLVEIGAPEGLEDAVLPIYGIKTADDEGNLTEIVTTFWEFSTHQEWKDFQTNRLFMVGFQFGVSPFFTGVFNAKEVRSGFQEPFSEN